jgi:hypothetical protein
MWACCGHFLRITGVCAVVLLLAAEQHLLPWRVAVHQPDVKAADDVESPAAPTTPADQAPTGEESGPSWRALVPSQGLHPRRTTLSDDLSDQAVERPVGTRSAGPDPSPPAITRSRAFDLRRALLPVVVPVTAQGALPATLPPTPIQPHAPPRA